MLKTLLFLGILALIIWFFFFKKRPKSTRTTSSKINAMVECQKCKTFVLQNEAILSNGAYYCSKECLLQG
ncbi:PP0621 family protein [Helicobacter kayseriensis]|uniref:PP0621 family protein n=1 Tax=Helicobacter kayseriensis TaxID=2905877 RepID=UPI001E454AEE|nr:PP0621 family protein [Helicobacter kayseriensis]MCE3047005.1 hypothetical protein [Helicobacter kayseriensis]MCE3048335.1 hypothetical protein [Helicobacter kayseriensis]